jgi:glycosyl transferase family 2
VIFHRLFHRQLTGSAISAVSGPAGPETAHRPVLEFVRSTSGFRYVHPPAMYGADALRSELSACGDAIDWDLDAGDDGRRTLRVEFARTDDLDADIAKLFATINRYPAYDPAQCRGFRNSRKPLVSCIILLTANDLFARRISIPSIVSSSAAFPIEIIVVYNGVGCDPARFEEFSVTRSSFGWVSRGYNKGVSKARGELVAIFHDDCIMQDPAWIEKSLRLLDSGAEAVSPEIRTLPGSGLEIARNVPLVMYRKAFKKAGGYDERYFAGMEDVDFTYKLLSSGKRIARLEVEFHHFDGMSTTILASPHGDRLRELYGLNVLPKSAVAELKRQFFERMRFEVGLVTASNMALFMKKFERFLASSGKSAAIDHGRALAKMAETYRKHPLVKSRRGLVRLFRAHVSSREREVAPA